MVMRNAYSLAWLIGVALTLGNSTATAEYVTQPSAAGSYYGHGNMPPKPSYGYGPMPMRPMFPPMYRMHPNYPMRPAPHMRPHGPPWGKMPSRSGRAYMPAQAGGGYGAPPMAVSEVESSAEPTQTADVRISQMRFNAPTVTIKVGGSVNWENNESVPHTITASDGSFGSNQLGQGDSFSRTFDQVGTYGYYCSLHPMMRGEVVVVE